MTDRQHEAGLLFGAALLLALTACRGRVSPVQPVADAGDDADATVTQDGGDAGACLIQCSGDLHSVVDCNGRVLTACPPDQGCAVTAGTGTCVAACDSAKANPGSLGCDYYSVTPDIIDTAQGACFAAFIANTWTTPVTLTVEYGSQSLDATTFAYVPSGTGQSIKYTLIPGGQIPAGSVAIVFLDDSPKPSGQHMLDFSCPVGVHAAMGKDSAIHGTGIGSAFHIATSAPVVAYDVFPYGGGQSAVTSATLLLPTSAWDTHYLAVDAFAQSQLDMGQPFLELVAQEDGTTITINPTSAIVGAPDGGVAAAPMGMVATYHVDKGQVLQLTQNDELTGSVVQANHPIGAWGGHTCLNIGASTCCCDSAHQQLPPMRALGSEYVGVRYRNRFAGTEEAPPWRVVGLVDGTTLTYDPSAPTGAPTSLGKGQLAQFSTGGPFVVRSQDSQHPFYMSAHMTGGGDPALPSGGGNDGRGDPEFVNVIPPAQYLSSYVFFTDPTYPETDLVIVRARSTAAVPFQDVTLDCTGVLAGWQAAGSSGLYQYTRVDLVTGNFKPLGKCNNGRHAIKSGGPFGVTVWGWGSDATGTGFGPGLYTQYVSYAYPAGASVQAINSVVVIP